MMAVGRVGNDSNDDASRKPNSAEKLPSNDALVRLFSQSGIGLLEPGNALARRPGRWLTRQQSDPRMAETMKVFGSRPDSATMVEGDRVEFRRIFAIKQDDGNIKLFDLLRQVRIVFAARRHDHGIDPALLEDPHQIELALLALVGNGQQQRIAAAPQDLFSSVDDRAEAGN